MIQAANIYHSYGNVEVLKGVDLEVKEGDFISIVGASGAGKTTLLQLLGTLEKLQKGIININGKDISNVSEKEIINIRNKEIGFVFQFHNLLAEFTALENVCIPAYIAGENKKETEKRAKEILDQLNLSNRIHHKPDEMSGGEKQRVSVARALINSPSIILADEPSGNLDSENAYEMHQLFVRLNQELNQTFIITTHNKDLSKLAKKEVYIKDGRII